MKKLLVLLLVVVFTAMFCLTSCSEMKDPVSGLDDKMEAGIEKDERNPVLVGIFGGLVSYASSCIVANKDGNKYYQAYGIINTAVSFGRYAYGPTGAGFVACEAGVIGSTTCQQLWGVIEDELEESESNMDNFCDETADEMGKAKLKGSYTLKVYYNGSWRNVYFYAGTEIRFSDYSSSTNCFKWCTVYYSGAWRNCYYSSSTYNQIHRGILYQLMTVEID